MIDGGSFGQKRRPFERWRISTPVESPQVKESIYVCVTMINSHPFSYLLFTQYKILQFSVALILADIIWTLDVDTPVRYDQNQSILLCPEKNLQAVTLRRRISGRLKLLQSPKHKRDHWFFNYSIVINKVIILWKYSQNLLIYEQHYW